MASRTWKVITLPSERAQGTARFIRAAAAVDAESYNLDVLPVR